MAFPSIVIVVTFGWQAVIALSAVAGVIVSSILGIRSDRRAGRDARTAAERSESAARLTEQYASRLVDAVEALAASGLTSSSVPLARGVRWSLTHHQGDSYLLENVGDAVAEDVRISSHESLDLLFPNGQATAPTAKTLEPGETIKFLAAPSLATSDYTITVRWTDRQTSEGRIWRYPLPPKRR